MGATARLLILAAALVALWPSSSVAGVPVRLEPPPGPEEPDAGLRLRVVLRDLRPADQGGDVPDQVGQVGEAGDRAGLFARGPLPMNVLPQLVVDGLHRTGRRRAVSRSAPRVELVLNRFWCRGEELAELALDLELRLVTPPGGAVLWSRRIEGQRLGSGTSAAQVERLLERALEELSDEIAAALSSAEFREALDRTAGMTLSAPPGYDPDGWTPWTGSASAPAPVVAPPPPAPAGASAPRASGGQGREQHAWRPLFATSGPRCRSGWGGQPYCARELGGELSADLRPVRKLLVRLELFSGVQWGDVRGHGDLPSLDGFDIDYSSWSVTRPALRVLAALGASIPLGKRGRGDLRFALGPELSLSGVTGAEQARLEDEEGIRLVSTGEATLAGRLLVEVDGAVGRLRLGGRFTFGVGNQIGRAWADWSGGDARLLEYDLGRDVEAVSTLSAVMTVPTDGPVGFFLEAGLVGSDQVYSSSAAALIEDSWGLEVSTDTDLETTGFVRAGLELRAGRRTR